MWKDLSLISPDDHSEKKEFIDKHRKTIFNCLVTKKYGELSKVMFDLQDETLGRDEKSKSKDESEICLFEKNDIIFNRILELNVPIGKWKRLNQKTISGKNADWFIGLRQKHCFVVEANISIKNNELNLLLPQKLYNGKCLINDIEFELISKFADIKVTNLYINDKKEKLENIFKVNKEFNSGYMSGSISNDIIYNMFIEKIKSLEFLDINNWIDSFENTLLLKKCLVFSNYNIKVIGYGQRTYLLTYIDDEEKNKIIALSKKLKLVYPVNIH